MAGKPRIETSGDEIPGELEDLGRLLDQSQIENRDEIEHAYTRVVDSVRRRRRILSLVQEALSQLRLDIKYLMFDLEATRSERDELREQLEEHDRGF